MAWNSKRDYNNFDYSSHEEVSGIFRTQRDLEGVLDALEQRNLRENVSVLMTDKTKDRYHSYEPEVERTNKLPEGASAGGLTVKGTSPGRVSVTARPKRLARSCVKPVARCAIDSISAAPAPGPTHTVSCGMRRRTSSSSTTATGWASPGTCPAPTSHWNIPTA